jgi:hypothetical protein
MDDNDGRQVAGHLPMLVFQGAKNPVVQVIDDSTSEILYTLRVQGDRFQPRVYKAGRYTVKVGRDKPDGPAFAGLEVSSGKSDAELEVRL